MPNLERSCGKLSSFQQKNPAQFGASMKVARNGSTRSVERKRTTKREKESKNKKINTLNWKCAYVCFHSLLIHSLLLHYVYSLSCSYSFPSTHIIQNGCVTTKINRPNEFTVYEFRALRLITHRSANKRREKEGVTERDTHDNTRTQQEAILMKDILLGCVDSDGVCKYVYIKINVYGCYNVYYIYNMNCLPASMHGRMWGRKVEA